MRKAASGPRDCVASADAIATPAAMTRTGNGMDRAHKQTVTVNSEALALKIGLPPGSVSLPGYSSVYTPRSR
ncbi:hypothetical protein D3C76_1698360 [compost metagenome]